VKQSTIHAWLMGVWFALGVPTVLWWKDSLIWVVAMSWYAIVASHWACREAAKADEDATT